MTLKKPKTHRVRGFLSRGLAREEPHEAEVRGLLRGRDVLVLEALFLREGKKKPERTPYQFR